MPGNPHFADVTPHQLRDYRVSVGLTQWEAAELCHLNKLTWHFYEMTSPNRRKIPLYVFELFMIKTGLQEVPPFKPDVNRAERDGRMLKGPETRRRKYHGRRGRR